MKLRRKLLAAGLALGATALTLTTSTFAWYTANTEVTATNIQGSSKANGDSLLLISTTGANGTYSNSVTFDTAASTTMMPVQYTVGDGTTSYAPTFNGFANGEVSSSDAGTTDYIHIPLYFRSSSATTVYLKTMTITNTTDVDGTTSGNQLPVRDILTTSGTTVTDLSSTNTYTMDILRSLKMAYYSETHTNAANNAPSNQSVGGAFAFAGNDTICTFATDSSDIMTNAHSYYNAVTGKNIATSGNGVKSVDTTLTLGQSFGITPASTQTNNDLCVHFYFFIDGWDLQCFDAVQGQSFTINMTFTSENPNS